MKHVPLRSCIVCRREKEKSELIRIVRKSDGALVCDANGREPGRGAYVCKSSDCIDSLIKKRALNRAYKQEIPVSISEALVKELKAQIAND